MLLMCRFGEAATATNVASKPAGVYVWLRAAVGNGRTIDRYWTTAIEGTADELLSSAALPR